MDSDSLHYGDAAVRDSGFAGLHVDLDEAGARPRGAAALAACTNAGLNTRCGSPPCAARCGTLECPKIPSQRIGAHDRT